MKILFFVLLIFHGLIHLRGYKKTILSKAGPQFARRIPDTLSRLLWLLAGILMVLIALAFIFRFSWWWAAAIPVLILSQLLIIRRWPSAKAGTLANVILLTGIITAFGSWQFENKAQKELQAFYPDIPAHVKNARHFLSDTLPIPVKTWLERSGALDKAMIHTVCLRQQGLMRTGPESDWYPFHARQWSRTVKPGFLWLADMEATAGIHIAARDLYTDGKGHMLIKFLSLVPVADASGPETDQGSMLRYLAEMAWYPTAALSDYMSWEAVDPYTAQATMRYKGQVVNADFHFNPSGDLISIIADRYYYRQEHATLEKWICTLDENSYIEKNGIRIPSKAGITWKLPEGDFFWLQLEITDISFNKNQCFSR